jgi:transposase
VPAVEVLRQVWVQQYYREAAASGGRLRWRTEEELPPAPLRIISPYDPEARFGQKRRVAWGGYKVHFTETCEADLPVLITDVQTTPPLTGDHETVPAIHAALAARDLLPATHLVDGGYVEAGVLVSSQEEHQVDLVGPAREDTTWQTREGTGFTARDFQICWGEQYAVCPQGQKSSAWAEKQERGKPVIQVSFALTTCRDCPQRAQCTRAVNAGRKLTLHPEKEDRALQAARARRATPEFVQSYQARAGIEGTHSQGVRRCGLRRCRYIGGAKAHLQHLLTAAALNFVRVADWLQDAERSRTRVSACSRLMAPAAPG